MTRTLSEEAQSLGPWFHNLHLPDGTQTCPDHFLGDFPAFKWAELSPYMPRNLAGWRCLDIGCNAGFYSFELAKRGARVRGIDVDARYLRQARWAARQLGLQDRVDFRQQAVYQLACEAEGYDLIVFMGVFYHLRYPLLALDIVSRLVRKQLIFQTLTMPGDAIERDTEDPRIDEREKLCRPGWPKMAFLEHRLHGDPTNWWAANQAGTEALLRSAGMRIVSRPLHETCLCEPDPESDSSFWAWNRQEYLDAVHAACGEAKRTD